MDNRTNLDQGENSTLLYRSTVDTEKTFSRSTVDTEKAFSRSTVDTEPSLGLQ